MKKILLAYDGTEHSGRALDLAADLVNAFHAELGVVSVVPTRPGRAPLDPWDDRPVHTRQLAEAKMILAARGIHATLLEPAGDPARTIERIASEGGFDTIVVGPRDEGRVARALQGSVSTHVATHAEATVVVAR